MPELCFKGENKRTPLNMLMAEIFKHIPIVAIYGHNLMTYFSSQRKYDI